MSDRASRAIGVLQKAGFTGDRLRTAFAIVMRESGGNPQAHNTNAGTGDNSYGLAQINMLGSMGPARRKQFGITSDQQLLDPLTNARAMYALSQGGKDFGAWGIGPNAYRGGAGFDTIAKYYNEFPGPPSSSGNTAPPAARPLRAPGGTPDPGFAQALIALGRARRGTGDIVDRRAGDPFTSDTVGPYFPRFEDGSGYTPIQDFLLSALARRAQQPQPAPQQFPAKSGLGQLQRKAGVATLRLPARYTGTHVTANLGWGTRTARDFMAKPGTTVGSPTDGTVEYFHPTGAQGGGSMMIRGKDGREYWLGHISHGVRPGTRVRAGQTIAVVANQHVSAPHVHEDVRG